MCVCVCDGKKEWGTDSQRSGDWVQEPFALAALDATADADVPFDSPRLSSSQGLSLSDVMREATFCKKAKLPILGMIENMSGFVCPHCSVREGEGGCKNSKRSTTGGREQGGRDLAFV